MENCMDTARVLKEGIGKTGRFEVVSKDIGVPLVTFSLKDSSKYTVFQLADSLRKFGWIIPAYTMPPDAEHIAVLRVVIREDFGHGLAERLISDIGKVLKELDELPPLVKTAHVTALADEGHLKKSVTQIQREVASYWKKVATNKTSGVC